MRVTLGDVCEKGSSSLKQSDVINKTGAYPIYGAAGYLGNVDFYHQDKPYVAVVKDGAGIGRTTLHPAKSSVIGTMQYLLPKSNVLPEYLYYVVQYMHLEKYFTGATIPHIYFKDYKAEQFNLDAMERQKEIVASLQKVETLIKVRQQQLQKLDELVKARFVEMFGMPGTDTKGWGLQYLGTCCELNPKKGTDKRLVSGLSVSFVPMPAVSESGKIDASQIKAYDEVKTGFTYFAENDVLFAKITPCMENGKGAVAVGLCNNIGFGSTEFHILRPINNKSNPYWLYSLTSFDAFRKDAADNMTGSAGQRRVPAVFLEKYKVTLPPIELQNQFAAFVEQTDKSKLQVPSGNALCIRYPIFYRNNIFERSIKC